MAPDDGGPGSNAESAVEDTSPAEAEKANDEIEKIEEKRVVEPNRYQSAGSSSGKKGCACEGNSAGKESSSCKGSGTGERENRTGRAE